MEVLTHKILANFYKSFTLRLFHYLVYKCYELQNQKGLVTRLRETLFFKKLKVC